MRFDFLITGVILPTVALADVCFELQAHLGISFPSGSYEKNGVCHGLFWATTRGFGEICVRTTETRDSCPKTHKVFVHEAEEIMDTVRRGTAVSSTTSTIMPTPARRVVPVRTGAATTASASSEADDFGSLSESPVFDLLAFGDWGNPRHPEYLEPIASLISDWYTDTGAVFLLGDNFYPRGINATLGIHDPAFRLFSRILAPSTTHADFYVVFGNHDYMGSTEAQLDYSDIHPKWKFPRPYYFKSFRTSAGRICAWFLDTDKGKFDPTQARWLNHTLRDESNNCLYKIVSGHHPVYDGGEYRSNEHLIQTLLPILTEHNVHLYLSGHEHQSQILASPSLPTTFLIAGAISDMRPPKSKGHEFLQFINMKNEAILRLVFFEDHIEYSFIPSDLAKRRKSQPPKPLAEGIVLRKNTPK